MRTRRHFQPMIHGLPYRIAPSGVVAAPASLIVTRRALHSLDVARGHEHVPNWHVHAGPRGAAAFNGHRHTCVLRPRSESMARPLTARFVDANAKCV